ncbi:glutaminase [Jeotgalibacillus campisalis]|uniref:Glutaminase n=1 Tax=Jeotgalibacillus campisalis TaxID=220754 RepID=A0A0C2VW98_9BACL|nr:glutaminase [Jeotgalibacillus campisalis]KIL53162.1 glutaminase [Jeotgalibacillus campisalis]
MRMEEVYEQLQLWVEENRSHTMLGATAQYIPALAEQEPNQLGICIMDYDGDTYLAGETDVNFTLQSVSKIISFVALCHFKGMDFVLDKVDVEPTGEAFNSIIPFEIHRPGKPFNPLINAGAITVASMLPGDTPDEKFERFILFVEGMIGRRLELNEEVYQSEWKTAHRNRALAYYLKESNLLELDVEEALEIYIRLCSISIGLKDLSKIGLVIAHDGYDPVEKQQIFSSDVARIAKVLMVTCGMYNSSGKFAAHVGLPAKSGVSGGILASVPPKWHSEEKAFRKGCGIAVFGPAIDAHGNSAAGTMLLRQLSAEWDLSIF